MEVELADHVIASAQQEAQRHGRTLEQQVAHWVRLGRSVEQSPDYDHGQVELALVGKIDTTALTDLEKAVWLELFSEKMSKPSDDELQFFTKRREQQSQKKGQS